MLKPLRVLMVEDSEDDAVLLLRTLKRSGYEPAAHRVQSADEMALSLADGTWDIIFCDYHMPGFSGLDAIALLQMMALDIPLIVVSGAIGEETALDCIHRGASDYIMKGNLARLGLAVERTLEKKDMRDRQRKTEAQKEEAIEALRQSESKYRTILESIGEGYYEADLKGNFTFFNNAMREIWGHPEEELMGMNNRTYMDKETATRLYQASNKVYSTGEPCRLFEFEISRKDGAKRVIQSSFALLKNLDGKASGFRGVVRDVTELKHMDQERRESLGQLHKSLGATINAVAGMVESRDPYTAGHQRRVADLADAIAREMRLEGSRIEGLRLAGLIHDLGKIAIPSEILTKPTKLTGIEYQIIQTHAQSGYDILKDIEFPWPIARMILEHHERVDGSGYPNHRRDGDILMESKILAVADVVEAMASHRPYRPSLGIAPALDEIANNKGILYDDDVACVCLKLFAEKRFNFTT
jgi:PAS domain S-box-containing protein/putative nucleotidyltransferase with HDIG domain